MTDSRSRSLTQHGSPHRARLGFALGTALLVALLLAAPRVQAGAQREEALAASVVAGLARSIADAPMPMAYIDAEERQPWLREMTPRIKHKLVDDRERRELLAMVYYEAMRAGLDPRLMLAIIYHESGFKKYAVSTAGALGYMQVMPFWVKSIGTADQNLFNVRTNLRYGATIFRHYLDIENGDIYRALGRYNGSLGQPEYPTAVMAAMNRYFVPAAGPTRVAGTDSNVTSR